MRKPVFTARSVWRHIASAFSVGALAVGLCASVLAAPFQNGSFESGPWESAGANGWEQGLDTVGGVNTKWIDITPGANPALLKIAGWDVMPNNVSWHDLTTTGLGQDGVRVVDLVGGAFVGGISQTFDTVAGTTYSVGFYATKHYLYDYAVADVPLTVDVGPTPSGTQVQNYALTPSDYLFTRDSWKQHSFRFVASGSSTTLRFYAGEAGVGSGNLGPMIDNVSVAAVPAPTAVPIDSPWMLFALVILVTLLAARAVTRRI